MKSKSPFRKISFGALLISALAINPFEALATNNALEGISLASPALDKTNQTIVTIKLAKTADYKAFYLNSPPRVVVDIKNATLKNKLSKNLFAGTYIKNIRSAQKPSGAVRIVFDLTQNAFLKQYEYVTNNGIELTLVITSEQFENNFKVNNAVSNFHQKQIAQIPYIPNYNYSQFKMLPQLTLDGFTGSHTYGDGELMFSFLGDELHNLYGVLEGGFGINNIKSEYGAAGLGYRYLTNNNSRLLGLYTLGEYLNSKEDNNFWYVNPGVESLGALWDFRFNGYFPVAKTKKGENSVEDGFASDNGIFDFERFTGHEFFDRLLKITDFEKAGYGVDAEVGRKIPKLHNFELFVGGYGFNGFENDNSFSHVGGIFAKAEIPVNDYVTIEARDSYDSELHNSALIGLKLNLGGILHKEQYGISGRLMDPIEHNIAATSGWNAAGIPVQQIQLIQVGPERLKMDHVWFFESAAPFAQQGGGDGTFENPFVGIDPGKMSIIQNDPAGFGYANLFFAPGNYGLNFFTSPIGRLPLPLNYSMFGRDDNYRIAASGDNRALFLGGFDIMGGNIFDSIRLLNDGNQTIAGNGIDSGIRIDPAAAADISNLSFNNVDVGITNTGLNQYDNAINLLSSSSLAINAITNSNFKGINLNDDSYGMKINSNNINIGNISNSSFEAFGKVDIFGLNIVANNNIILGNIIDSSFSVSGTSVIGSSSAFGMNIVANNNVAIGNIDNSKFVSNLNTNNIIAISSSIRGNKIVVNDITNSSFFAQNLASIGNAIAITLEGDDINLGNIVNTSLLSFAHEAFGANFVPNNLSKNNIKIGNILNSSFEGNGPEPDSAGIFVNNADNIIIGDITNSTFTGANAIFLNTKAATIGNITGNAFNYDIARSGYGIFSFVPTAVINIANAATFRNPDVNTFSDNDHKTNF